MYARSTVTTASRLIGRGCGSSLAPAPSPLPHCASAPRSASVVRVPVRCFGFKQKWRKDQPSLIERTRPLIQSGVFRRPSWWETVQSNPPPSHPRVPKPGPIRFPEDELVDDFLRLNPVMRYEAYRVRVDEKSIAVSFARHQHKLMTGGMTKEAAYAESMKVFGDDIKAFAEALKDPRAAAQQWAKEIQANLELRTMELRRARPLTPEERFEMRLAQQMGKKGNAAPTRRHAYAVNTLSDILLENPSHGVFAQLFRDVLRMTARERHETSVLTQRLLDGQTRFLQRVTDAAAQQFGAPNLDLARMFNDVATWRTILVLLQLPEDLPAGSEEADAFVANLARQLEACWAPIDPEQVVPVESQEEFRQTVEQLEAVHRDVRKIRALLALGREAPHTPDNVVGYDDLDRPVYIGDRSKETPPVPRSRRALTDAGIESVSVDAERPARDRNPAGTELLRNLAQAARQHMGNIQRIAAVNAAHQAWVEAHPADAAIDQQRIAQRAQPPRPPRA